MPHFSEINLVKVDEDFATRLSASQIMLDEIAQTTHHLRLAARLSRPVISKEHVHIVQDLRLIEVSLRSPLCSEITDDDISLSDVTIKVPPQITKVPDIDVEHDWRLKKYEESEVSKNILTPAPSREFSTHTEETSADIKMVQHHDLQLLSKGMRPNFLCVEQMSSLTVLSGGEMIYRIHNNFSLRVSTSLTLSPLNKKLHLS